MDSRSEMVVVVVNGKAIHGVYCNSEMAKLAARVDAQRLLERVLKREESLGGPVQHGVPSKDGFMEASD